MTAAEAARLFGRTINNIYVLAHRHHWASTRRNGRTYYDPLHVAATLGRPATGAPAGPAQETAGAPPPHHGGQR
jgi:hypothetical protein